MAADTTPHTNFKCNFFLNISLPCFLRCFKRRNIEAELLLLHFQGEVARVVLFNDALEIRHPNRLRDDRIELIDSNHVDMVAAGEISRRGNDELAARSARA